MANSNALTDERSTPTSTPKRLKFEQLRADYELFLQTFEKPTWIYRLLQRRAQISPFMLHRNLSYIREPHSISKRKNKIKQQEKRAKFKVDNILQSKEKTVNNNGVAHMGSDGDAAGERAHYMNMSFGGFFHGPGFAEQIFLTSDPQVQEIFKDDFVNVDIHLVHVYHKKKKDKQQPLDVIPLGECQAPWNPRTQLLLPCTSVQISVPPIAFADNGRQIKTHLIAITVSIIVPKKSKKVKKMKKKKEDEGGIHLDESPVSEPPLKKVKTNGVDVTQPNGCVEDKVQIFEEPIEKITATFSAELIVYDKHKNCLLTNGDYELLVQENVDASNYGKHNSWENKFKNKLGPFAAFSFGPTIKFSLSWESKPVVPCKTIYKSLSDPYLHSAAITNGSNGDSNGVDDYMMDEKYTMDPAPRVFYQFIYSNSTRQQTEAREGASCPWCGVKTRRLYGLMKHLKCCHTRFMFLYTQLKTGHRIDVCVNPNFEASLAHNDAVAARDIGYIVLENAPLKRTPQTNILVARPEKHVENLSEFTEPETGEELDGVTSIKGHERTYYHTANNQKMHGLSEYNPALEDSRSPAWLVDLTGDLIEEFTDVNEGEKMLMKMWNIHILKKGYIADHMIVEGCKTFVQDFGNEIISQNLTRNFIIHLNSLIEFQVIPQSAVVSTLDILFRMKESKEYKESEQSEGHLESNESMEPIKSVKSMETVGSTESVESMETVLSTESVESMETVVSTEPVESMETVGSSEPVESNKLVESKESVESKELLESEESVDSNVSCGDLVEDGGK